MRSVCTGIKILISQPSYLLCDRGTPQVVWRDRRKPRVRRGHRHLRNGVQTTHSKAAIQRVVSISCLQSSRHCKAVFCIQMASKENPVRDENSTEGPPSAPCSAAAARPGQAMRGQQRGRSARRRPGRRRGRRPPWRAAAPSSPPAPQPAPRTALQTLSYNKRRQQLSESMRQHRWETTSKTAEPSCKLPNVFPSKASVAVNRSCSMQVYARTTICCCQRPDHILSPAMSGMSQEVQRVRAHTHTHLRRHSARQWRYAAGSRRGSSSSAMASACRPATCSSVGQL